MSEHAESASIGELIEHASHLLPDQGPMDVFVHHNTLHAFQHLPFHEAVQQAGRIFGAEPYMAEDAYRDAFARGRIEEEDLAAVLRDAPQVIAVDAMPIPRDLLLRTLMLHRVEGTSDAMLSFLMEEGELLSTPRKREIWGHAARLSPANDPARSRGKKSSGGPHGGERLRDRLLRTTGEDTDERVHPILIKLAGAYLDLGLAYWPMPRRAGFYEGARDLIAQVSGAPKWLGLARDSFARQAAQGTTAEEAIVQVLDLLGVAPADRQAQIEAALLALPGWAGMFNRLEKRPPFGAALPYQPRVADFIAVRLALDWAAAEHLLADASRDNVWLAPPLPPASQSIASDVTYRLFQVFQLADVAPELLATVTREEVQKLLAAMDSFDEITRRMAWHEAYERWHRRTILTAIARNRRIERARAHVPAAAQLVFCIDDREESLRRHIEELRPDFHTHGTAGFFGLAIAYEGMGRAHAEPLCPANQVPKNRVVEEPFEGAGALHETRLQRRRMLGRLLHGAHHGARGLVRGALVSILGGALSIVPLVTRVLFPRLAHASRVHADRLLAEAPQSRLVSDLTTDQAADKIARTLEELGIVGRFARLVVICGHGSSSINNPYASAYECGACGGHRGAPNARLFADLANRADVRAALAERGVVIPEGTWFVGGFHDTSNGSMPLFDVHAVPETHTALLAEVRATLERARRLDAHERCRRFETFDTNDSAESALVHVESRAESLAEPRAEYCHCTNAMAIIGRRELTRGLFLDRRAFLVCYDPRTDTPDGQVLERILGAAAPVGAGINLEYYFSFVDNDRYGAGSKLPHNVVSLLGVVNGHMSDLRTGLASQMVELHEPVRMLTVVESTPEVLLAIAERSPVVKELVMNGWLQLVSLDPDTGAMQVATARGFVPFEPDASELASFTSSTAYYKGQRDHLWPARIERAA
jgi:uncharacterized protein